MKPMEIVKAIKEETPNLLGKTPDKKAAQIINAALKHIKLEISTAVPGRIVVPGLGVFVVKKVEIEKDGEKRIVDRIGYRIPKGKKKVKATEASVD